MRLRVVVFVAMIGLSVASCDDDDHHATATVESVQGTKACIRPEDREQTNLRGCFPVTTEDAVRLRSGQCIEVDIPNYLVDENKDLPLKSIKVLDRRCSDDGDSSSRASRRSPKVAVRCTEDGVAIDGKELPASADGVHLPVKNTTEHDARLVASPARNGTETIPPGTSTVLLLAPPGEVRLQCGPEDDNSKNRSVAVMVKDPHGFYRSVNLADALGCEPDEYVDGAPPGWGPTAREAADAFAAQLKAEVKVTEGNGYRDQVRQEFVLHVNGRGYGTVDAYPDGDRYWAAFGIVCSSREAPGYKPGTAGGDG